MARFNPVSESRKPATNLAGGPAYREDAKTELALLVLTSFVQDQFYRTANTSIQRVRELVQQVEPLFCAKLAIYARDNFGMRTISHVLAVELLPHGRGTEWIRTFYDKVVIRADDVLEILAYHKLQKGRDGFGKGSNAMRHGLGRALSRMSEYQLAKYRGGTRKLKLVDAVNICHPKRTPALDKLMKDELPPADTWEVRMSKVGQQQEDAELSQLKADTWKKLLVEKRIGYFALLRNLRNIYFQAHESLPLAISILTDPFLIEKSRVLPFRYLTAWGELVEAGITDPDLLLALSHATDVAIHNVPSFDGKTLILVDVSGSMIGGPKAPIWTASLFGAAMFKANNAQVVVYSETAKLLPLLPTDSTMTIATQIREAMPHGGTNLAVAFRSIGATPCDRIILLSDMQSWMDPKVRLAYLGYCARSGAHPKLYSFDLAGYGSLEFPQQDVFCLAGFSEKIFSVMKLLEEDPKGLVHSIESVNLSSQEAA